LSGLDAVKKIVETETQARRTVEEAKTHGQQIIARAHEEADMIRKEFVSSAQQKREEILTTAREKAEAEAQQSDLETDKLLLSYRKLSDQRKADAVAKAVELVLNS
jgi:ATP synthase H subunit